jgi:hypothetical protein
MLTQECADGEEPTFTFKAAGTQLSWWVENLAAQLKSGQTQAVYCRAQGLDPKYFYALERQAP